MKTHAWGEAKTLFMARVGPWGSAREEKLVRIGQRDRSPRPCGHSRAPCGCPFPPLRGASRALWPGPQMAGRMSAGWPL